MPYTNAQHPSNTRTTVTIVMSIIFGISIIPTTALGAEPQTQKKALVFSLENADYPTLLQEVKVKIEKGTTDPVTDANGFPDADTFVATDEVYFITTAGKCVASPATEGVTPRTVTVTDGGASAMVTVIIKSPEFAVSEKYKMCYIKAAVTPGTSVSTVYEASYLVSTANKPSVVEFKVHESIFTEHKMDPDTVPAGQEGVKLSITVAGSIGGPVNGKENQNVYLVPCAGDQCMKDNLAQVCRNTGNGAVATDVVTTGDVTESGTSTLTTTFTAPANPTSSYRICVPYCFQPGSCTIDRLSWALVNSKQITFLPKSAATQLVYALKPTSPQARTWTQITFTGTDLTAKDKIRIVAQGQDCSTSPLSNIEYTQVTPASGSATSSVFKFRLRGVLQSAVTGQVCYARDATPDTWKPVYKSAGVAAGDLVISPLQPTGFTVSPVTPEIGQVLKVTFTGNGLEAGDLSYLVKCTTAGLNEQLLKEIPLSKGTPSDYCDDDTVTKYTCVNTKEGDNVNCKVLINPPVTTSDGMQLCACYRKIGHTSYALVARSVELLARNPTYTILPYPFTVGVEAKLKFTGTGLSAEDQVKIIAEGDDCTTDGALGTQFIKVEKAEQVSIKKGEEVTYSIMGSASVSATTPACFTVCYLRNKIWTVSTNSGSSTVIPTSCKSASSLFLSPKTPVPPKADVSANGNVKGGPPARTPGGVLGGSPPQQEGGEKVKVVERKTGNENPITPTDGGTQQPMSGQGKAPDGHITAAATAPTAVPPGERTTAQPQGTVTKEETTAPHNTPPAPKANAANDGQPDTSTDGRDTGKNTGGVRPKVSVTVPPKPDVNKSTTLSATAISSTIPAVLITSVVFLYLYNW